MSSPTAVIFDLDGTLVDTEPIWDEVRRGLAAQAGLPWPEEATAAMMGLSTQEWSTYLHRVVGLAGSPPEAAAATISALQRRFAEHLPILPGAVAAVRRMAEQWPLGVASSSPRVLIEAALESMGVRALFAAVRSTEEGEGRGKPAPDAFLWVAGALGVAPANAVVVEDSSNGVLAAVAAGMKVVAIPPHFQPPPPEVLELADLVLDDLDGLTVEAVSQLLER